MYSEEIENIESQKILVHAKEEKDLKNKENNYSVFLKICVILILMVEFLVDIKFLQSSTKKHNACLEGGSERYFERFFSIIPSFIRSNSNGFFETNRNGLMEIPSNRIYYKREESCFIQKIELNQMSSVAGNIDVSLLTDIAIIHSDANFKIHTYEQINKNESISSFVVKYISGYMSINTEDIKLKDSFKKKIEEISDEKEYTDIDKAVELDKLFKSYGFYIPQKIYVGGSFIIELSNVEINEKRGFSMNISGKTDITNVVKLNGTSKNSNDKIVNFLNNAQKSVIIGGDKKAENFQDWKSSIDMDNIEVISYDNIIEITNILDRQLKKKLKKPFELIEEKYNLRKKYYGIIADLKKKKSYSNKKVGKYYSEGICEKENELIYSIDIHIREKWDFKGFDFQKSYPDVIIGWEIESLETFNGECRIEESPLLKKEIKFNFVRQFYILGSKYDIKIFLMKYPD